MEWKVIGKDELGPAIRARPVNDEFEVQIRERTKTGLGWSKAQVFKRSWKVCDLIIRDPEASYSGPFGLANCYDTDQIAELIGGVNRYWKSQPRRTCPAVQWPVFAGWEYGFGSWRHGESGSTINLARDFDTEWSDVWGIESKGKDGRLCHGGVSVRLSGYPHMITVIDTPSPAETVETIPAAEWDQVMERIASFVEHDGAIWIATITNPDGSQDSIGGLVGNEAAILAQALEHFPIMDAAEATRNRIAKLEAEVERINRELERIKG